MSSRTKGFFEQDHTNKVSFTRPRPMARVLTAGPEAWPAQWNPQSRNRIPLGEGNPNIAPAKPPIPPTTQAKSKLKAFQFIDGAPHNPVDSNTDAAHQVNDVRARKAEQQGANAIPAKPQSVSSAPLHVDRDAPSSQSAIDATNKTPQLPHANTFPSTPGMRLPLEDLIGNFDENAKRPESKQQSPEEYIGWIPNSPSTLLTPNRKRKRARSSSPSCPTTSSQRHDALAFFAGNGTQMEARTPEADPVADLWQRYAASKGSTDGLSIPNLHHLMFEASPRPLETPAKSAGLRRWASTGNDWPNSKNKRRKTTAKPSVSVWQERQDTELGGKSRVAAMVEKIQETLALQKLAQSISKPATTVEPPSSSSPPLEIGAEAFSEAPNASPLQARQQHQAPRIAQTTARSAPTAKPSGVPTAVSSQTSPIQDALAPQRHALESVISAPLHLRSKGRLPGYRRPAMSRSSSGHGRQYPTRQSVPALGPAMPAVTEDLDEFGDAFDLSVEDLEELVSQVPQNQRPLHEIPQHPNPPQQQPIVLEDEGAGHDISSRHAQTAVSDDHNADDDEFGDDDIDEASFAQAEVSATQALRASNPPSNVAHAKSR